MHLALKDKNITVDLKQKEFNMSKNESRHPKGYWMAVGISVGLAIGVAMGPLFDRIGIGIAIGIAIGSGIGASLEQRNKDNLRPLTEGKRHAKSEASSSE